MNLKSAKSGKSGKRAKTILILASAKEGQGRGHWQRMQDLAGMLSWFFRWWGWRVSLFLVKDSFAILPTELSGEKAPNLIILDVRDQDPYPLAFVAPVLAIDSTFVAAKSQDLQDFGGQKSGQKKNDRCDHRRQHHRHPVVFYDTYPVRLPQRSSWGSSNNSGTTDHLLLSPVLFWFRIVSFFFQTLPLAKIWPKKMLLYAGKFAPSSAFRSQAQWGSKDHQIDSVRVVAEQAKGWEKFCCQVFQPVGAKYFCQKKMSRKEYFWHMSSSSLFFTYFGQSFFEACYLLKDKAKNLPVQSQIHENLMVLLRESPFASISFWQPITGYVKILRVVYQLRLRAEDQDNR